MPNPRPQPSQRRAARKRATKDHFARPPPTAVEVETERASREADFSAWVKRKCEPTVTSAAHAKLEKYLEQAHLDPEVHASPEHLRLVSLLRQLLWDSRHTETLEQIVQPIISLAASAYSKQGEGGRPPGTDADSEWLASFCQIQQANRALSKAEIYRRVAKKWEAEGNAPRSWAAVRDGVERALLKADGKPPLTDSV